MIQKVKKETEVTKRKKIKGERKKERFKREYINKKDRQGAKGRKERERGAREWERKGKGKIEYKSSLLGHFGVPLPVSPAMLYFSSPSAWSTILKVISCYPGNLNMA